MGELRTIRLVDASGMRPSPDELDDTEYGVLAVDEKDRVVAVVAWMRIRTGAPGTGESSLAREHWECVDLRVQSGLYDVMTRLPGAIREELERREEKGLPHKRLEKDWRTLGYQLLEDEELCVDLIDFGLENYLKSGGTWKL